MGQEVSLRTKKMLWGRAAGRCSICRTQLVMTEEDTDDPALIGEECHIVGHKLGSARYEQDLALDRRNLYENLILLCRNHHKEIDDQPNRYTVAILGNIKNEHQEWISSNIDTYDEKRQADDEHYASIVERWEKDCRVDNWESWASWVCSESQPRLDVSLDASLFSFRRWIFNRVWPGRYQPLERAFHVFLVVLQDFQETFRTYTEKREGNDLVTRKFYQIDKWDEELYWKLARQYDYHVDLVQDLMLELSRAGNLICDEVRKCLHPAYRLKEGRMVVSYGPTEDFKVHWVIPRYQESELDKEHPYTNLDTFKQERVSRDVHFGSEPKTSKPRKS
jgi:hypothetical protein